MSPFGHQVAGGGGEGGDTPFPGMVRRRLVSLAVELDGLGLLDGGWMLFSSSKEMGGSPSPRIR